MEMLFVRGDGVILVSGDDRREGLVLTARLGVTSIANMTAVCPYGM